MPGSISRFLYYKYLEYRFMTIPKTLYGRIRIGNRKINLSTVFGIQYVGIREVADRV
jgi:hypothetical protein